MQAPVLPNVTTVLSCFQCLGDAPTERVGVCSGVLGKSCVWLLVNPKHFRLTVPFTSSTLSSALDNKSWPFALH